MSISPTEIIFSDQQQLALLGHSIVDAKVFEAAQAMGVTALWFYNANHQSIWKAMEDFEHEHRRHPSIQELKSTSTFLNEEKQVLQARTRAFDQALVGREDVKYDTILLILKEWAKGQLFVRGMEKAADLYNRKDVGNAYGIVAKMNIDIDRVDQNGIQSRSRDATERVRDEKVDRVNQKGKLLRFGIPFLDEATGGIGVNELVLVGAKPGAGKTQLVTNVAQYNTAVGKRVTLFALEAEPNEIERRIKFAELSREYRKNHPNNTVNLNYRDWRHGEFQQELDPYEDVVNNRFDVRYSKLRTIYKGWGDYRIGELERDIVRAAPTTDLIVIDHLHYIDTEGEDQNAEMKQIVKTLRDLALVLCKPIILVAHMRKTMTGRKNMPLIPDLEDFHGSSDIIKIATMSIILAPCYDGNKMFQAGPPADFCDPSDPKKMARLWATYMRIAKYRLDGSVTRYCAVTWYDDAIGRYRDRYTVGRLVSGDTEWEPEEDRPFWAKNGTVLLRGSKD
jgi:replicative DNA helicase